MTKNKLLILTILMVILLQIILPLKSFAATYRGYKGTVTLYGTPEAAIKKGPTYGSKVKIDLGTRTGQSWNNVSYTIPQVSEYFTLNDGWAIDYVSVAGNSSGSRQPRIKFFTWYVRRFYGILL